jgi:quercetin dioxygenase-like cupin family protein
MSVDGPLTNLGRALPKETRMNDVAKGNLLGMVGYQEGAVVSRTLVDKKSGTVTLFAFAQGQGLSEHTAPFDALVQLLEGEAEITVSGTPFRLGPGEVIVMPANEPHALRAIRPFKMMLTMIRS